MKVFNNIWLAISTPNELLVNIIAIPAMLLENFLIMTLFTAILDIKPVRSQKIIYVLSSLISFVY